MPLLEFKRKPIRRIGHRRSIGDRIGSFFLFRLGSMASKWTHIYRNYGYDGKRFGWGSGSDLTQTAVIREEIPRVIEELDIKILLDCPCGDLNWMQHVDLKVEKYIGVDIVKEMIDLNRQKFKKTGYSFYELDMTKDVLPKADMILCRDCLVHFSFRDAAAALNRFRESGTRYILTTTFPKRVKNSDTMTGVWRPLNLQLAPFSFPDPIKMIDENCSQAEGLYKDKSLGLWRLQDV